MIFSNVFGVVGLLILAGMICLWIFSLARRDASIVDIFWGSGFVIACWAYFLLTPEGYLPRKLLLCTLVTIWGLRLSVHLFQRNWGRAEDFRYAGWREQAGERWWWQSLIKVFLLQGFLLWVISAPLLAAQLEAVPDRLIWRDAAGLMVWIVGFTFEALGDRQLARFKCNPANRGKVMDRGLWRYTRHPNYFGDAMVWWGFFLFALATGQIWTIFSPLMMTFLLVRVSGAAMLERTLAQNKPGYREYMRRTSAFVPLPPRREDH